MLTPAQVKALAALEDHNGEGVLDKAGVLVAAGTRLKFMPETWLRLVTTGHCEPRGPMRIGITDAGRREVAAAQNVKARIDPKFIHSSAGNGHVQLHDGAE